MYVESWAFAFNAIDPDPGHVPILLLLLRLSTVRSATLYLADVHLLHGIKDGIDVLLSSCNVLDRYLRRVDLINYFLQIGVHLIVTLGLHYSIVDSLLMFLVVVKHFLRRAIASV